MPTRLQRNGCLTLLLKKAELDLLSKKEDIGLLSKDFTTLGVVI